MAAYQILPNSFRRRILARERLIGCWSTLANPITTEILGLAGFDWLLLDTEHAPNDIGTLVPQLMALKDSTSAPVARPGSNDAVAIKRLLDIGFANLLIPMIESADDARRAVAASRYPPQGIRGVAMMHRGNRYATQPHYGAEFNDHVCVLLQIENQAGIDALDAILEVDGVDGIFVGPSDLSASLGHFGQPNHPEVMAAIEGIRSRADARGKATGILTGVEADARRYIDDGFHFVAVGTDQGLFRNASQGLRDRFASKA